MQTQRGKYCWCRKETLEDDITFDRMYWIFAPQAKRCVRGRKMVFSFDAAFCKQESGYDGQLLNMSGVDGNGNCIPIAFAIVPTENTDSYRRWMQQISEIVIEEVSGEDGVKNDGTPALLHAGHGRGQSLKEKRT